MVEDNFDQISLERRLLGSFLVSNRHVRRLIRTHAIAVEQFTDQANRLVWLAISGLVAKGQIASPVTVRQWIEDHGLLDEVGGARYLALLAGTATSLDQISALLQRWQDTHPQTKTDWWRWYNAYLLTDVWRARRSKVLERCGGVCEGCREVAAVEVHHLTYDHVGEELLFELVGLCAACHSRIHE